MTSILRLRSALLMGVSVAAFGALSAPALAQDAAGGANMIEELVVTAEKREQSLQTVPIAISAFTSEQRDKVGISTVQDLTNFTPGFVYQSANDRAADEPCAAGDQNFSIFSHCRIRQHAGAHNAHNLSSRTGRRQRVLAEA